MTNTLSLKKRDSTPLAWPEAERHPMVPDAVWDNLYFHSVPERNMVEVMRGQEVYATINNEDLKDTVNLATLVRQQVVRHYLIKVRPELLVC